MNGLWARLFSKPKLPAGSSPSRTDLTTLRCKYCGGEEFYAGPEGGLAVNILCANRECRHWFNHTVLGFGDYHTMDDLFKVEDIGRYPS